MTSNFTLPPSNFTLLPSPFFLHPSPFTLLPSNFTEDTLVQQTTAEYLEDQLKWRSVYAYNQEDFGPESLLGRALDREVVLTRPLRAKLVVLNPDLPTAAYDDAVRQLVSITAAQSLLAPTGKSTT